MFLFIEYVCDFFNVKFIYLFVCLFIYILSHFHIQHIFLKKTHYVLVCNILVLYSQLLHENLLS